MNACYSEKQAEAIAEYIPCVIGMNQAIGDSAAIAFSVGFYKALGAGRSVEDSYHFACVEIQLEGISEHLTPVLYSKQIEFSKNNDVISFKTKERFEYTPITIKQDRKLFLELIKDFPPNGRGARFLKEHDVGNTIHSKDLEQIDYFLDNWADVMHEFLNPELEEKRQNLISILRDFQSELNVNIWPIGGGNLFSMYLEDFAAPKHLLEAREKLRDKLNNMATQAFDLYQDLLRCCKIILGTVDNEN